MTNKQLLVTAIFELTLVQGTGSSNKP